MTNISSCINCTHATFQKTATGRLSRRLPGKCGWSAKVNVPNCMVFDNDGPGHVVLKPSRSIWYGDGKDCATFEVAK